MDASAFHFFSPPARRNCLHNKPRLFQHPQVETQPLPPPAPPPGYAAGQKMFLRFNPRKKDGKTHRYWSVVENRRLRAGHPTQRTVLYLGEIHDPQQAAWRKSLDALNETTQLTEQIRLFPDDREIPPEILNGFQVKLSELTLQRPRVFGDCWRAGRLWDERPWARSGARACRTAKPKCPGPKCSELLAARQRVAPGSKWPLPRRGFLARAMDPLLDEDFAVAAKNRLDECRGRIAPRRTELFPPLPARGKDLFGAMYDRLLDDRTRTYFEGDGEQAPKAQHGCSRDRRSDCRQAVIAGGLSPEGFTLADGEKTVRLRFFLCRLESGEPQPLGCAAIKWINCAELDAHDFPAADARLIEKLKGALELWQSSA